VSPGNENSGGIIRNNFFFRTSQQSGDNAIGLADSPNTQVLNNTVFLSGTYSSPIEYRFAGTSGVVIANNITDGIISARDGATGTVQNNLVGARADLFVNAAGGDLHLAATATSAIDRGAVVPTVTDDWDGEQRPNGAAYDIGADERGASTASYQIGGHVIDGSTGAPLINVSLRLSGGRAAATTSDASGAYAFTELAGGADYTVTPSDSSHSFSPASAFYAALSANQPLTDFRGFAVAAPTPTPSPTPSPAPPAPTSNKAPTIRITSPSNGATFTSPATITITASVADSDGRISRVRFYSGDTLLSTDTYGPNYSYNWRYVRAGTYTLKAVATDDDGASTTSATVTVTVKSR